MDAKYKLCCGYMKLIDTNLFFILCVVFKGISGLSLSFFIP